MFHDKDYLDADGLEEVHIVYVAKKNQRNCKIRHVGDYILTQLYDFCIAKMAIKSGIICTLVFAPDELSASFQALLKTFWDE